MSSLKEELIEMIKGCEDKDFLAAIHELLQSRQSGKAKDWWNELSPLQKNKIEEALTQYKTGDYISHQDIQKKLEEWRKK